MLSFWETGTCDGCEFHREYFDEIDGRVYHDGCICCNDEADNLGFHEKCCNSEELCPYKRLKEHEEDEEEDREE